MKWPNPTDYQDTVQNPKLCFSDPELKAGTVAVNQMGLPRVASGNFASVYEVQHGRKRWAVRCFLRQAADQQRHYEHVSRHLKEIWLPFLVDFEYQPQGIRVSGQMYPIVKMQWVEGVALHSFVRKYLRRPDDLLKLAAQWRGMANSLYGSRLAHGDLQHGNALVTSKGYIRLVDYDAMYVPALHGTSCAELGHANYQHPQRTATHYDHHLDNFAALAIYVSLRALAVEPELWDEYHTGENLIFSSADFKAPAKSALFQRLKRSKEPNVQFLATHLEQWCCQPIAQVGNFETVVSAFRPLSAPQSTPMQTPAPQSVPPPSLSTQSNPWWLDTNTTTQQQSVKPQVQLSSVPFAAPKQAAPSALHSPPVPQIKINPIDGAEMVWIPEGEFIMGSNRPNTNAVPKRHVWLDGFWMYKHAVTCAQYQKFCVTAKHIMPPELSSGWQPKYPIVQVSWFDALAYCQWAGVQLPSEAHWEKAARGIDERIYPWGNTWDPGMCCNSTMSIKTKPVDVDCSIGASSYGILNMSGNVWEWCQDQYEKASNQTPMNNVSHVAINNHERIVRGGSFGNRLCEYFTTFRRFNLSPSYRADNAGFRCIFI